MTVSGTIPNKTLSGPATAQPLPVNSDGTTATVTLTTAGGIVTASGSTKTRMENLQDVTTLTVVSSTDPAISAGATLKIAESSISNGKLTDYGTWTVTGADSSTAVVQEGVFAGGKPEMPASATIPASGSATFTGDALGFVSQSNSTSTSGSSGAWNGKVSLTADFGAKSLTGNISNITIGSSNRSASDIGLSASLNGSSFSGTTSAVANNSFFKQFDFSGATGSITGALYGDNGAEAAATFTLSGGANNVALVGSLGAYTIYIPSTFVNGTTLADALATSNTFSADSVNTGIIYGSTFPNSGRLKYDAGSGTYIYSSSSNYSSNSFSEAGATTGLAGYNAYGTSNYTSMTASSGGTTNAYLALAARGSANTNVQLTYVSYGLYGSSAAAPGAYFVFGVPTPYASIPVSGSATYNGILEGAYHDNISGATYSLTGTSTLTADFAAATVNNSLSFTGANQAAGGAALGQQTFAGSGKILNGLSGNTFYGDLAHSTDLNFKGSYEGRFFGPSANEIGYTFTVSKSGTSSLPAAVATGVVVGR